MRVQLCLFLILLLGSCKKQEISTNDIIRELILNSKSFEADGTSVVDVVCVINENATSDKREVILKISTGQFVENKEQKLIKKAEFIDNKLVVKAQILVPMRSGKIIVSAEPNLSELKKDYILSDSVVLTKSTPASIKVEADSFAVSSNFKSDVTISGLILNSNSRKVSLGVRVLFEDLFQNGTPVGGRYRNVSSSSNTDSKVNVVYSPGLVPIGSNITIRVTVLDELGQKTNIKDTVEIYVNN